VRITSDDDVVIVDVTAAQGPPGPPGPPGADGVAVILTEEDPSDDGLEADLGALALYTDQSPPILFLKFDAADDDWTQVVTANAEEIHIENKTFGITSESTTLGSTGGSYLSLSQYTGVEIRSTPSGLALRSDSGTTVSVLVGTADPSSDAGLIANPGSLYQRDNAGTGELWLKTGAADTAWQKVALVP
jgi:hypothetical protein